jgi:hypothetical protein
MPANSAKYKMYAEAMFPGAKVAIIRQGETLPNEAKLPGSLGNTMPKDFLISTKVVSRIGFCGKQWHTGGILNALTSHKPSDAYAIIGLTNEDLYAGDNWAFVFGWASYTAGVGTFSFKRYDPSFDGTED